MRFKFAYAVSIAAAIAMATACGKKDEGGASTQVSAASQATVVKIGHVAPLTGLQAHLGRDNENGARAARTRRDQRAKFDDSTGTPSASSSTRRRRPAHRHRSRAETGR